MSIEGHPPAKVAPGGGYEFNESENRVFLDVAKNSRHVGFWFEVYGILLLLTFVFGLIPKQVEKIHVEKSSGVKVNLDIPRFDLKDGVINIDPGSLISGLIFLLVGNWSRRAARGFQAVAKTQGGDVGHLMGALKNLAWLYGLLGWIVSIVVFFVVLLMLFVLAVLFMSPNAS